MSYVEKQWKCLHVYDKEKKQTTLKFSTQLTLKRPLLL